VDPEGTVANATLLRHMTIREDQAGWIGRWSPGIGDPSIVGWVTVLLYVAAAWTCLRVALRMRQRNGALPALGREPWLWSIFCVLLFLLGVNKQLDLQTALTELGRMLAHEQGWYARRAHVQKEFIGTLFIVGIVSTSGLLVLIRHMALLAKLAAVGMCFIGVFVLIRASSFHKVDAFLGSRLVHLRMNWLLEIGGISIVLLASLGRLRSLREASPSA
jgi:hypothetical protein